MKRMTKNKFAALIAVLLLLTLTVAGTLAYLVDSTESLVNTFTATDVDVTVTDKVENGVKSNVVITNTGTTSAYIRARIVGKWVDDESGVVVKAWNSALTDDGGDGDFSDLPGTGWVKNGNYYYYTQPVAPGNATGTPLFTSYTVTATVAGAHLEMDILVQAIQSEGGAAENAWGIDPSKLKQTENE